MYAQYKKTRNTHISAYTCKQYHAQNKQYNMQHKTDTEQNTEQHNTPTQPQQNSTDDLHTYSFDIYHEYAYIKNSDTIELYTISKENI